MERVRYPWWNVVRLHLVLPNGKYELRWFSCLAEMYDYLSNIRLNEKVFKEFKNNYCGVRIFPGIRDSFVYCRLYDRLAFSVFVDQSLLPYFEREEAKIYG